MSNRLWSVSFGPYFPYLYSIVLGWLICKRISKVYFCFDIQSYVRWADWTAKYSKSIRCLLTPRKQDFSFSKRPVEQEWVLLKGFVISTSVTWRKKWCFTVNYTMRWERNYYWLPAHPRKCGREARIEFRSALWSIA